MKPLVVIPKNLYNERFDVHIYCGGNLFCFIGFPHDSLLPFLFDVRFSTAYELAVIVHDGLKGMNEEGENRFYYITLYNDPYPMGSIRKLIMYILQGEKS